MSAKSSGKTIYKPCIESTETKPLCPSAEGERKFGLKSIIHWRETLEAEKILSAVSFYYVYLG